MNVYYFRNDKIAFLGAIKAQLAAIFGRQISATVFVV